MPDIFPDDLLTLLIEPGSTWSLDELIGTLGRGHPQVIADLARLRVDGCEIADDGPGRIRLLATGLSCWADYLRASVKHELAVEVYQKTSSTQDVLKRRLELMVSPAAVALADEQTAGRGRRGRRWLASAGDALLMSLAWPMLPDEPLERLPVIGCLAVAEAVHRLPVATHASIRWPNDVLLGDRKLAGILVERLHDRGGRPWAIIGWGINIHASPAILEPRSRLDGSDPRPISLHDGGVRCDRLWMARAVLERWLALSRLHTDELAERWRQRSGDLGRHATLESAGTLLTGEVVDVDLAEGLVLRDHQGVCHCVPSAQASRSATP